MRELVGSIAPRSRLGWSANYGRAIRQPRRYRMQLTLSRRAGPKVGAA
jgi:hypothetical protein